MAKTFRSFEEAGAYFTRAALVEATVGKRALNRAGKLVLKAAKDKFGHYQPRVGQWARWEELAPSTLADKEALGFTSDDPLIRSGDLKDSLRMSSEFNRIVIGSANLLMVYHEMGTARMPPRAVLGPALYENRHKVAAIIGESIARGMMYGFVASEEM